MEHEALAKQTRRIAQEPALLLARQLCHLLGPADQFEVPVVVAQPHQPAEQIEILLPQAFVLSRREVFEFQQVPARQPRHVTRLRRIRNPAQGGLPFQNLRCDARNRDLLRPREDRREQPVRLFAYQNENRPFPRLLEDFQDLVRRLLVHRLRKPYQHRLVIRLVALERQLADHLVGLARRDHPFERLPQIQPVVPLLRRKVSPTLGEQRPELRQELVAQHRFARLLALFVHRKDQMQVRMRQSLDLFAVRAFAARIPLPAVPAAEVLHIGDGQSQRPVARGAREQLRMAHPPRIHRPGQMPFQILLSDDIRKSHPAQFRFNAERSIAATSIRSRRTR